MEARELMTPRPVAGTPETTIRKALVLLRRGRFRHLPVVRGGRLWGVVSDRDLQRALAGGAAEDDPLAALVHRPPITAAPDTPVEELARLLLDNKIGCLPIVWAAPAAPAAPAVPPTPAADEGAGEVLVGIVTESDVFRAFMRALGVLDPGSRVVVHLYEPSRDLVGVARVLAERNPLLLALTTTPLGTGPDDVAGQPALRLVLRLGTIDPRPVVAALTAAGLLVERPVPPSPAPPVPAGGAGGGG
jgi:acetoin utilization protein AcuB